MADEVQRIMERMIPELEDIEEKGIMTHKEIGKIADQRRDYEYLLQRMTAKLIDYRRYIEFEKSVENLIEKRRKRLNIKKDGKYRFGTKKKICHIYDRAVRRFTGNLELWREAIDYAVATKSTNIASKLIGRVLQLHPRNVAFWILAGSNEYEKGDMSAARAMMQRGLRLNAKVPELWIEYFRLEMMYLHKLRERRLILGIDDAEKDGGVNTVDDADDETQKQKETKKRKQPSDKEKETVRNKVVYEGALPRIVYKKALEEIPSDVSFRASFASVLSTFYATSIHDIAAGITKVVWNDIEENLELNVNEEGWNLRALFEYEHAGKLRHEKRPRKKKSLVVFGDISDIPLSLNEKAAIDVFDRAFEFTQSSKMRELIAEFYRGRYLSEVKKEKANVDKERIEIFRKSVEKLVYFPENECDKINKMVSPRACEILCSLFEGSKMHIDYCLNAHPKNARFALRLLSEKSQLSADTKLYFERVFSSIECKDNDSCALEIWLKYIELSIESEECSFDDVVKCFKQATLWFCNRSTKEKTMQKNITTVLGALFLWVSNSENAAEQLPNCFRTVLNWGFPAILPVDCFTKYIEIAKSKISKSSIRYALDRATECHSDCRDLWIKYLRFERQNGDLEHERRILLRASKIGGVDQESLSSDLLDED